MIPKIEHFRDHYRVIWPDGSTTEVDTYEEAEEEIAEKCSKKNSKTDVEATTTIKTLIIRR